MRWLTAGESHGPTLVGIVEGIPAHGLINTTDIDEDIRLRRVGFGR